MTESEQRRLVRIIQDAITAAEAAAPSMPVEFAAKIVGALLQAKAHAEAA